MKQVIDCEYFHFNKIRSRSLVYAMYIRVPRGRPLTCTLIHKPRCTTEMRRAMEVIPCWRQD